MTSEAYVRVFAMICQHDDSRQQDASITVGSEVSPAVTASRGHISCLFVGTAVTRPCIPLDSIHNEWS